MWGGSVKMGGEGGDAFGLLPGDAQVLGGDLQGASMSVGGKVVMLLVFFRAIRKSLAVTWGQFNAYV